MIEKIYNITYTDNKIIEKKIIEEKFNYIHMVFNNGEGLPEHYSNANLYMTVLRGILSIGLDEQEIHEYEKGSIINIPVNTKMNVNNTHADVLELIVIKVFE